ncbi:MAG TPA: biopolymer transporter ExbD [Desulfobacterales bacterium]|nr:biopolymer transporter ExbD [Desulfobacterales bacterium]
MKLNYPAGRKARIEMLPLIDMVFILLVFFVYAMLSMAVHRGLPVKLPASAAARVDKHLLLAVTIKADGVVYVDHRPTALADLTMVLKGRPQAEKDSGVLLFAARNISYQQLFHVLDRIKAAGLRRISLQADADGKS